MALRGGPAGLTGGRLLSVTLGTLAACTGASRRGDTTGVQTYGRWEWHARLLHTEDSSLTLERLRIDTAAAGTDVALVRYEFHPVAGLGAASAITLGMALGRVRALRPGVPYALGTAIPAYATVTCLCPPLRSDSVRGTFLLVTRGMRQLTGRVDATVYLSEWNTPSRHVTYALHQRFDAVK